MRTSELKDTLKPEVKRELPRFANFRQEDTIFHEIHKYEARTLCGRKLDGRKNPLKCTLTIPNGGAPCQDCEAALVRIKKAREQRALHKTFEYQKRTLQKTASKKRNTLGKKQVFNTKAQTFSMDTPDITWDE